MERTLTVVNRVDRGNPERLGPVELELERFERIRATEGWSLVRVCGRWAALRGVTPGSPTLLVDDGAEVHRSAVVPESQFGWPEDDWRVTFAVPSRYMEDSASWALDAGVVVDLPAPVEWNLRGDVHGRPAGLTAPAEPLPSPQRERRSRTRAAGFWLIAVAAAVAVVAALAGGISPDRDPSSPAATETGTIPLRTLSTAAPGVRGRVLASSEQAITLELEGLRPGRRYGVWLYGNVLDAVPMGSVRGPSATVRLRFPLRPTARRYLDVSDQGGSSRGAHSGRSLLRLSTSALDRP